jgi:hypothetical protein
MPSHADIGHVKTMITRYRTPDFPQTRIWRDCLPEGYLAAARASTAMAFGNAARICRRIKK